jgi:hypothetical protein
MAATGSCRRAARETVLAPRPAADGGALMPALGLGSATTDADVP